MSSDYGHLAQVRDRAMTKPHHPQKLVNVRLDCLDAVLKHYVQLVTDNATRRVLSDALTQQKELERICYEHTKLNPNLADDRELVGYVTAAMRAAIAASKGGGNGS